LVLALLMLPLVAAKCPHRSKPCGAGFHTCGNTCAANGELATCGSSCTPCQAPPANAAATCDGAACGFTCNTGFARCGDNCCLPAPTNVVATPGPASIRVTWDLVPGATSYRLYWSTTPGVTTATGTPASVAALPFIHGPIMPSQPVYYVVTAVFPSGEGLPSSEVSATPLRIYGSVAARYPAHGAAWNDYLKNDGATRLLASDTACDPVADTGGYSSCLHGGEMRAFTSNFPVDCAGVTAEDDLLPGGAFHWVCDSSVGFRLVSTGLKEGVFLSDLLERDPATLAPRWKQAYLQVWKDGVSVASSTPEVWWSNPVLEMHNNGVLSTAGAVYLEGAGVTFQQLHVTAPRVALVAEPASGIGMLDAADTSFLWIEGSIGAFNNFGPALRWSNVDHSVIRGLGASSCFDCATLLLDGVRDSSISDLTTAAGSGSVLHSTTTTYARVHFTGGYPFGTTDTPVAGAMIGGANNVLTQVTVSGGGWLALGDRTSLGGHVLVGFTGANATSQGPGGGPLPARALSLSHDNSVAQAVVVNSEIGLAVDGPGNRLYDVAACDNAIHGVEDWAADTWWFNKLIVGSNGSSDCWKPGTPTGTPTCPAGPQLFTGCTLAGHFVGKVTAPDAVNRSAANPAGPLSGVTDWTRFVDRYRGWGIESPDVFPAASNRGRCFFGPDCRMWDWSLMVGPAWLKGDATGQFTAHPWFRATPPTSQADCDALVRGSFFIPQSAPNVNLCQSVLVFGAIELAGDGIGNDNGLCEPGETCVIAPNFGSYQGHGPLGPLRVVEPVPGKPIIILVHAENGYTSGALP
jgi:hypothetical protein